MANPSADRIMADLTNFLEQLRDAAFNEGRVAGRADLADQLRWMADSLADSAPRQTARGARAPRTAPTLPAGAIAEAVAAALGALAPSNPDGADPHAVADHLNTAGTDIAVHQVRQGLRQLTLSGQARRVARGRYLPNETSQQTPQQQAAE